MRASEHVAEQLQRYGATHFFQVPVILPELMKELVERGVQPIVTHGEKAAAYMADGYARVSRRPGLCGSQAIGSTNLAAGLRDAYMARTPVIAFSGGINASSRHRNLYQHVDDRAAFEAVCKWNAVVDGPERLPDLIRQAYRAATSGIPRPVHLEVSGNIGNVADRDPELAGDVVVEPEYARTPSSRGLADQGAVAAAARTLAMARRPVILAGNGAVRSGASSVLLKFAHNHDLPVLTSLNGMSVIADGDERSFGTPGDYGRDSSNRILHEADVVLVVGSSLGSMTTKTWTLVADTAKVIQIDVAPEEIGRIYANTIALAGDAEAVLTQVAAEAAFSTPRAWLDRIAELHRTWVDDVAARESTDTTPLRPERLLQLLMASAADDAVLVGDTGHVGAWTARHLKLGPRHTYIRAAGSLGWGLPAAIGASFAAGGREVVCLTGDAGVYYHIAELETARRYGTTPIVVVNNNVSMNQEAFLWEADVKAQKPNWTFTDVDFAGVARAMDCFGARVDEPADLGRAFAAARASGKPALLDVRTDIDAVAPASWGP
jgi:acetolactate synthase I/II/III large subunit